MVDIRLEGTPDNGVHPLREPKETRSPIDRAAAPSALVHAAPLFRLSAIKRPHRTTKPATMRSPIMPHLRARSACPQSHAGCGTEDTIRAEGSDSIEGGGRRTVRCDRRGSSTP